MKRKILIVDDEPQIVRVLRTTLETSGYEVDAAGNGVEAMERFLERLPDLVITDLSMPEMDGIELTRELRQRGRTPIIVLSVRNQDAIKVRALDEGADDYVTKPFSTQELLARVRSHLRRTPPEGELVPAVIAVGDFVIDTETHRIERQGTAIHLTPKEFDLLVFFARNADRVLTHKVLLKAVWGPAGVDQPEYLRVLVGQLRRKIEPSSEPRYILSEPWVGYRFVGSAEPPPQA